MSNIQVYANKIEKVASGSVSAALPAHIKTEQFMRIAKTALYQQPKLAECTELSVVNAITQAAQDGLKFDGREAALVIFKDKAQYMPMYRGLLKLAKQSGAVKKIHAEVVRKNDKFVRYEGDENPPLHEADWFGDRGEIVGAFAYAILEDDDIQVEIMSKGDIESIRKRSRSSGNGPWVTDWAEMARKTVIRRLIKYIPASSDKAVRFQEAVQQVDNLYDFKNSHDIQEDEKPSKVDDIIEQMKSEANQEESEIIDADFEDVSNDNNGKNQNDMEREVAKEDEQKGMEGVQEPNSDKPADPKEKGTIDNADF